ncbi:MAG: ISL3 family transposase, partial [Sulfitobacter sp.]|nr:ISL3 family transposase [Sulfitobacter sp.]
MTSDGMGMCELLVGLGPNVSVVAVFEMVRWLEVTIETRTPAPLCGNCATTAELKDRDLVAHVDLPSFGQPTRLVWRKRRWVCPALFCGVGSWTEQHDEIAPAAHLLTTRAGRWVTVQVGRWGRSVKEVAAELDCDWHTVNRAVIAYGQALIDDDVDRIPVVRALSLDETLFKREGRWRTQRWSTQLVDARTGQLLDVVEGRTASAPAKWLAGRDPVWLSRIQWAVLDLSGPYRSTFNTMLPDAVQVADPFHVVKLANQKLDECRRRVQQQILGHRGHKADPLFRARRLLTIAHERLDPAGDEKLRGLLAAGDPKGEVAYAWHAKEAVRFIYDIPNPDVADRFVAELAADLQDDTSPAEVNSLGRTLTRWHDQIVAWHRARATNGPAGAINNLVKRVKRVAFGFRSFR